MNPTSRAHALGAVVALGLLGAIPGAAATDAGATSPVGDGVGCLIVPGTVAELGVELPGVVDEVLVGRGERVGAGRTLVTLRADVERAALAQAIDRADMDSESGAREADVEFTRQVLERQRSLRRQNLAPQQSVDEALARHLVAEAALRRARDNEKLDEHELLRQDALRRQRVVASPFDATVLARHVAPGERVVDGPVLTVGDLDTLAVEAVLPAAELGRFAVGDVATVVPETTPERPLRVPVTAIDPMLDAASGTFGMRLEFGNADRAVVAGQECVLRFDDDGSAPGAPAAALPDEP